MFHRVTISRAIHFSPDHYEALVHQSLTISCNCLRWISIRLDWSTNLGPEMSAIRNNLPFFIPRHVQLPPLCTVSDLGPETAILLLVVLRAYALSPHKQLNSVIPEGLFCYHKASYTLILYFLPKIPNSNKLNHTYTL